VLRNAQQADAALADIEETVDAQRIPLQVENEAGQVGRQGAKACLAVMQHFEGGTVIGTLSSLTDFALDRSRQAIEPVEKHDVMDAAAQGLHGGALVGRLGDDDQWCVEIAVMQRLQRGGRAAAGMVQAMHDRIPVLLAKFRPQGRQAGHGDEIRPRAIPLPGRRHLLDQGRRTAYQQQVQCDIAVGWGSLHSE